jgi:hypothetical protein
LFAQAQERIRVLNQGVCHKRSAGISGSVRNDGQGAAFGLSLANERRAYQACSRKSARIAGASLKQWAMACFVIDYKSFN